MFDFNQSIKLENERVRLTPLDRSHMDPLSEIAFGQPELLKYSPSEINDPAKLALYFNHALASRENEQRYPFVIYDKDAGRYAGSTSYGNVSNEHKRIEIGWTWIGEQFQRTGLNRACKLLLLDYAFEKIGFQRVELKTDGRNHQSRQAILGIGAQYEGSLRSHTVMYDGYRRDTVYYGMLRDEWPRIKSEIFKLNK